MGLFAYVGVGRGLVIDDFLAAVFHDSAEERGAAVSAGEGLVVRELAVLGAEFLAELVGLVGDLQHLIDELVLGVEVHAVVDRHLFRDEAGAVIIPFHLAVVQRLIHIQMMFLVEIIVDAHVQRLGKVADVVAEDGVVVVVETAHLRPGLALARGVHDAAEDPAVRCIIAGLADELELLLHVLARGRLRCVKEVALAVGLAQLVDGGDRLRHVRRAGVLIAAQARRALDGHMRLIRPGESRGRRKGQRAKAREHGRDNHQLGFTRDFHVVLLWGNSLKTLRLNTRPAECEPYITKPILWGNYLNL